MVFFLRLPTQVPSRPKIDVAGISLPALASTALVLTSTWGGTTYAWGSVVILGLIPTTLGAIAALIVVERRTPEPVMPMHLFRDRNFDLTTVAGLIIGVAMFGALAYLPTYLQIVTGAGAIKAGLLMIPMMGGLLVASTLSGQAVSRTGRYKMLPVVGTLIVGLALALLSTMSAATATAANNYFRQIGASLGAAVACTLLASRLSDILGATSSASAQNSLTPDAVSEKPLATTVERDQMAAVRPS